MSVKQDFIDALLIDLPPGIADFVAVEIPTLTAISTPADVDAAIIAQGVLAANLNLILQSFTGLTPVDVLLHIGQRSMTAIGLLLASLELCESYHEVQVITPTPDQVYNVTGQTEIEFTAAVIGYADITKFEIDIAGDHYEFTEPQASYTVMVTLPFDGQYDPEAATWSFQYTATFTATFADDEDVIIKGVSLTVEKT